MSHARTGYAHPTNGVIWRMTAPSHEIEDVSIHMTPGVAMPNERSEMEDVPDRRSDIDAAVVTKPSPWSPADTLARLSAVAAARGMEVFAVIDHCAKARD